MGLGHGLGSEGEAGSSWGCIQSGGGGDTSKLGDCSETMEEKAGRSRQEPNCVEGESGQEKTAGSMWADELRAKQEVCRATEESRTSRARGERSRRVWFRWYSPQITSPGNDSVYTASHLHDKYHQHKSIKSTLNARYDPKADLRGPPRHGLESLGAHRRVSPNGHSSQLK